MKDSNPYTRTDTLQIFETMYLFSLSWLSVNEHISFSNNIPLLLILVCSLAGVAMQLHISPSLRHVTVFPGKGVREFIKVKVTSRRPSYRMVFYSLLFVTFLLRFVFVLTAMDTIEGETQCTSLGTTILPAMNTSIFFLFCWLILFLVFVYCLLITCFFPLLFLPHNSYLIEEVGD